MKKKTFILGYCFEFLLYLKKILRIIGLNFVSFLKILKLFTDHFFKDIFEDVKLFSYIQWQIF